MEPIIELKDIEKSFGKVNALQGVSLKVHPAEVHCLLGDNGAGKSTMIKILSGVHQPTKGEFLFANKPVSLESPREALDLGIATVFQDLAMLPLMSITRNFFLGREPKKSFGPLKVFDTATATTTTLEELRKIGIKLCDTEQTVGTPSGGERQAVAIARAVYFGAKVLILDEPTSALGVQQSASGSKIYRSGKGKWNRSHLYYAQRPSRLGGRRRIHDTQSRAQLRNVSKERNQSRETPWNDGRR
jgi:simple sugar transport system ATP-binding protein